MSRDCGDLQCSVCGREATACWADHATIAVCPACATDVLPALAADSIDMPRDGQRAATAAKRAAERMLASYWRGVALRAVREGYQ